MQKEGKNFTKEENILELRQLGQALEETGLKLETSYKKKDYENFDASKKLILQIQKKISEIIK